VTLEVLRAEKPTLRYTAGSRGENGARTGTEEAAGKNGGDAAADDAEETTGDIAESE